MKFVIMALLCNLIFPAQATVISLASPIEDIGQNYFGGGVVDFFELGEVINFSFTYEPDDTVLPGDSNGMKYVVSEFTLSTNFYTATVYNRGALKFTNGDGNLYGSDYFSMSSGYDDLTESYGVPLTDVPLLNGYYLSSVGLSLGSTRDVFDSDSLSQPLNHSDFDFVNFHFAFREPGTTHAMGTMQSSSLASLSTSANSVPIPGTLLLFVFGLLGIVFRATSYQA